MSTAHLIIGPIVNTNFGNDFHHKNGTNQCQHFHKKISQKYQLISYQIPRTSSIPYLKEYYHAYCLNNKGVRELLMQHDGKSENCTFRGQLSIKAKAVREQPLQNNHNNGSRPKYF